jgi:uncharacterized protein (TIGR03067 family)
VSRLLSLLFGDTFTGTKENSMTRWLCLGVVVMALIGCSNSSTSNNSSPKDRTKTDFEKIQGAWVLTSFEWDGRGVPEEEFKDVGWTFEGEKYIGRAKTDLREGTFKLDPNQTPKAFDYSETAGAEKGRSYRGIYRFILDDELVLCFGIDENADRPKEFTGKAGSRQRMVVFKRKKT